MMASYVEASGLRARCNPTSHKSTEERPPNNPLANPWVDRGTRLRVLSGPKPEYLVRLSFRKGRSVWPQCCIRTAGVAGWWDSNRHSWRPSLETHAAIDQELCADCKRRLIGSQKYNSIRDLTWLSEPSGRNLLNERSLFLL